ncbi:hypothetical protein GA0116948_111116 [Chitinophaga costaii]|uniref:Uncharacterized protein n=1 Tax=Chitinophaga costaii TaxID=1335309 RepID=A0A1C4F4Z2_9BACT|nr:hypothetical protein GA0116948_111116 [Chitinophaga costaii]
MYKMSENKKMLALGQKRDFYILSATFLNCMLCNLK